MQKIANLPDVKEIWAKQGAVPIRMTPAEFGKFMEQVIQKWAKVVAFSGAKVDQDAGTKARSSCPKNVKARDRNPPAHCQRGRNRARCRSAHASSLRPAQRP